VVDTDQPGTGVVVEFTGSDTGAEEGARGVRQPAAQSGLAEALEFVLGHQFAIIPGVPVTRGQREFFGNVITALEKHRAAFVAAGSRVVPAPEQLGTLDIPHFLVKIKYPGDPVQ